MREMRSGSKLGLFTLRVGAKRLLGERVEFPELGTGLELTIPSLGVNVRNTLDTSDHL